MVRSCPLNRRGFTLVEALVAMALSSVIVVLVTSVFLVQNQFYADTVARTSMHENVRGATLYVSSELRAVASTGITVAEADSIVFRMPLVVGGVCDINGTQTFLHFPLEGEGVVAADVDGYAVRDADGAWTYTAATWGSFYQSSGRTPARRCEGEGADTVGATADFYRLDGLVATPALQIGDLVMLYQVRELKLATSTLDPSSVGVYTGPAGGTLMELATGLSGSSAFSYLRAGQTTFESREVGVANLAAIEVVRLFAKGIAEPSTASRDSLTFELTVTVPLRNVN